MTDFDLILVGGGLANGLIALRLARLRPELRVAIVEAGTRLGGCHTWSSFDADLTPDQRAWTAELYRARWPAYRVRFPATGERLLAQPYASATSEHLDAALRRLLPADRLITAAEAVAVEPDHVVLADQRRLSAAAVIDGRGARPSAALRLGWQKFLGCEIEVEGGHGVTEPLIMDAAVDQHDGYRFVYLLPFSPSRILIEDTYYADGPELDDARLKARIGAYADARGWVKRTVVAEERGVLPIAMDGDIDAYWAEAQPGVAQSGMRAALFHPMTGYSFPDAVALADHVAGLPTLTSASIDAAVRSMATERWRQRGYYRMLARMLFRAAEPDQRFRVLERFYGLDAQLIARFYAGTSSLADKARILMGRPPVPVGRAVRALLERG